MSASDVYTVLSCYALGPAMVRHLEFLENAGGFSGSRLWQVTDVGGRVLCLRRWPAEHPTAERLRLIHSVLKHVESSLPSVACPLATTLGTTFIDYAAHFWELTDWRPGTADYRANPTRKRLRAAMRVLAQFHELAGRYESRVGAAPAVSERMRQLKNANHNALAMIERSLDAPLGNEIDERSGRLAFLTRTILADSRLIESLSVTPELPLMPAIRDIHHEHVLFTGELVTGLIDFGALRIDTPLTDVARLVGSLAGDDREARQFAFAAYSELRPLGETDRRLIGLLDESSLVISALNWLNWLYLERRDMGPLRPIVLRLDEILRRLEARRR